MICRTEVYGYGANVLGYNNLATDSHAMSQEVLGGRVLISVFAAIEGSDD